ncbi:MAG: hypothetical protein QNK04_30205 [Myxococcota bacterium]|nr:hypothetical protein [Myxococcota bacterium]
MIRVLETLQGAGHASFLVGGCVRDLLRGQLPTDFDVATAARPEEVLALFPRAVAVGIRHGTIMLPCPGGPIDVTTFRAGSRIEDDLAHRDFTLNAIAADPASGEIIDPFEGRADLEKGLLRGVGSARDRFAEDPLRALRAARFAACLDLELDPEVVHAMEEAAPLLRGVARERIRRELEILLLAPGAGSGLAWLARTGIEAELVPDAAGDAAEIVPALPPELELRLAAWLRGARATAVLRRLRFPKRTTQRVDRLLRCHPIEAGVSPLKDASVRRQIKRAGEGNLAALVTLRRVELERGEDAAKPQAARALARLAEVEAAFARLRHEGDLALRRQQLAIDGVEVMRVLGSPAGPRVGAALRHLTDLVIEDPTRNEPRTLRRLLQEWADRRSH